MQTLHHKKNKKQEIEFFQDKECTIPFDFTKANIAKQLEYRLCIFKDDVSPWADIYDYNDKLIHQFRPLKEDIATIDKANKFMKEKGLPLFDITKHCIKDANNQYYFTQNIENAKDLYIELKDGDITPLTYFDAYNIFTPYIPNGSKFLPRNIKTLNDITPNLSKYIPEDNAVLFLSLEDEKRYGNIFQDVNSYYTYPKIECEIEGYSMPRDYNKVTIFLPHGTKSELKKANTVAKELKEKYGIEEVHLFILHCFIDQWLLERYLDEFILTAEHVLVMFEYDPNHKTIFTFNKIITTNSTGILKPEDSNERLQVIDCKEIFEDFLNGNK